MAAGRCRAEPGDFIEGEFGSGGDDEVVVGDAAAVVELEPVLGRVQALGAYRDEFDPLALEGGADVELDVFPGPPVHGDPGIARNEMEARIVGDDGDLVFLARELAHLVGHRHAAQACSQDDDMCHAFLPPRRCAVCDGPKAECGRRPHGRTIGKDCVLGELWRRPVHSHGELWANTPSG